MDLIIIKGLEIEAFVGVPDEERQNPQRLEVDAVLTPSNSFGEIADDINRTVDYHAVIRRIARLAETPPRRLIETLAQEIAAMLIAEFPAQRAEVEVRKFILPETEYVAVRCARDRQE
ncbi:MAG TPA: dihydroneopterin aldolase [Terrimicrobiaceae bacterium]|nr:dihydroneopterin aldolase [Terrimicrobiaceae bacterium]